MCIAQAKGRGTRADNVRRHVGSCVSALSDSRSDDKHGRKTVLDFCVCMGHEHNQWSNYSAVDRYIPRLAAWRSG